MSLFVFGHKSPDTDSICSAVSLAYLKNKLGVEAKAYALEEPRKEAKFVLDYANYYADREIVNTLIVLDIFPLSELLKDRFTKRDRKEIIQLIKKLKNNKVKNVINIKDIIKQCTPMSIRKKIRKIN